MARNRQNREIVGVVEQYVDLELKGYGDRPYYVGVCPFHDEEHPSFVVFPRIQRWVCYGCDPDGGDVVDFIAKLKDISLQDALKEASEEVSPVQATKRRIEKIVGSIRHTDNELFNYRIRCLYVTHDVNECRATVKRIVRCMKEGKLALANRILTDNGV